MPKEFLRGVLYGVTRGDGTFNDVQKRCTTQMSRTNLIRQLYLASLACGLVPSLSKTSKRPDGRIHKSVNYNAGDFNKIADICEVSCSSWVKSKNGKLDRKTIGHKIISKVTSISDRLYSGWVFDLQVSGSHTYVANFVCVHNCQYCGVQPGTEELSIDHVIPRAQGGKTTWDNVVIACVECNRKKADKTPEQAKMKLRKKPGPPAYDILRGSRIRVDSWCHFLGDSYWGCELK